MCKLYVIGVGPGSEKYLTDLAKEKIREADIVVGWDLDLLPAHRLIEDKEVYVQNAANYLEVVKMASEKARAGNKKVAVLRVGDPCISSGLKTLLKLFNDFEIEIIPGISSVQLAAAIARVNIDESVIVSFHDGGGTEEKKRFMLDALRRGRHVIMLAGPDLMPDEAARYLIANGIERDTPVVICENLTLENEKISKETLESIATKQFSWLSIAVIINKFTK